MDDRHLVDTDLLAVLAHDLNGYGQSILLVCTILALALVNAGVHLNLPALADPVAIDVAIGLVLGKLLGIVGFSAVAVKLGLATQFRFRCPWLDFNESLDPC